MITYLVKLMEDGEYQKCVSFSQQLLLQGGMNLSELATLNMVMCRARLGLDDPFSAIPSGILAVKIAGDIQEWDTLGRALLNLGNAYVATNQFDEALQQFYQFLQHNGKFGSAARFEGAVWKAIGISHQHKLEHDRSVVAFARAREWFTKNGVQHGAFTCTHDLINTHLQWHEAEPEHDLDPVRDLLKEEQAVARAHPEDAYYKGTYLYDKAALYLRERRYKRAIVAAMLSMETYKASHELSFHCHMVLHECTRALGLKKDALGYALAARVEALAGRRFELEFLAVRAIAQVIKENGMGIVRELDEEYQAIGVDLARYLPASVLQREN